MNWDISWITILFLKWTSMTITVKADDLSPSSSDSILSLPQPDESLETIIKEKRILVDKTKYLEKLVDSQSHLNLLSRPNGFGKTIFQQMVKKFFLGERGFFKGTTIYERGNRESCELEKIPKDRIEERWLKYPVIHLNFADIFQNFSCNKTFENSWINTIKEIKEFHDLKPGAECDRGNFHSLLSDLHRKYNLPVVVLVDDYDAPWNHVNHVEKDKKMLRVINGLLSSFFQTLKHNREDIRFVLVTGVLRLGFNGISGGMDFFKDLTYDKDFLDAFGFTHRDMISHLHPYLERFSKNQNKSPKDLLNQLHEWYGYYSFSKDDRLKNQVIHPVSAIKYLEEGKFSADHMMSVNNSILQIVRAFYEGQCTLSSLEHLEVPYYSVFHKHWPERDTYLFILMLLNGYLTIERVNRKSDSAVDSRDTVTLTYPNIGAKEALKSKIEAYVPSEKAFIEDLPEWTEKLQRSFQTEDYPSFVKLIANYGFFNFSDSSDCEAYRTDVINRVMRFTRASKIKCEHFNLMFQTSRKIATHIPWYADFSESKYEVSKYVLRVTNGEEISQIFHRLVEKFRRRERINCIRERVDLIAMNLATDTEWISTTVENGKIVCDKLLGSSAAQKRAQRRYCSPKRLNRFLK